MTIIRALLAVLIAAAVAAAPLASALAATPAHQAGTNHAASPHGDHAGGTLGGAAHDCDKTSPSDDCCCDPDKGHCGQSCAALCSVQIAWVEGHDVRRAVERDRFLLPRAERPPSWLTRPPPPPPRV